MHRKFMRWQLRLEPRTALAPRLHLLLQAYI